MNKALVINTHEPYESSRGALNGEIARRISASLEAKGWTVRTTKVSDGYAIDEEAEKHAWADVIVLQGPVNWMGFPWSFKKYQDEVYGALGGVLFDGDGRHRDDPSLHYGSGA